MNSLKYSLVQFLIILFLITNASAQNYHIDDLKIAISRGACFVATLSIDNTSILNSNQNNIYNGKLVRVDDHSAFVVAAYPQGQNPSAANKVDITAYSRSGGHQEISVTRNRKTKVYYPNEITSSRDDYGYHFVLGNGGGNLLDQLVSEQIRIDISEIPCKGVSNPPTAQPQQPTIVYQQVHVPVHNSNEGCSELQDALASISKKMYPWPNEEKGASWLSKVSKKIFDAPQGCIGRDDEVLKIMWVAENIYPKFHEDGKRYSWVRNMINTSLSKPSRYKRANWATEWEEIIQEAKEIFEWHKEEKRAGWVTKKINKMYNN